MTQITASLVKDLRERTGEGMMVCKKALEEAGGDIEQAIEALRAQGRAKALKKESRQAVEGLVVVKVSDDNKKAAIVEVNCETDFVAKQDEFRTFVEDLASLIITNNVATTEELLTQPFQNQPSVNDYRAELVGRIGENIQIRRAELVVAETGCLGSYSHGTNNISRIGAVVAISNDNEMLAKDIAMHVAAMNPEYISAKYVDEQRLAKEKDIILKQVQEQDASKPESIQQKIAEGRLQSVLKEITLYGQPFVKEPKMTIQTLLEQGKADVTTMIRYGLGEGLEKKKDDFVSEVMSQVKG